MPSQPTREPPGDGRYPIVNGLLPSITDCDLVFVDDEEREHQVLGWSRFTFDSGARGDPVSGGLEVGLVGVEVEVEVPEHSLDRYVTATPGNVRRSALGRTMGQARQLTQAQRDALLTRPRVDAECTCGDALGVIPGATPTCPVHGWRR